LGELAWQVHAAPGHDPHSVVLFEPASRTLISADALWENGFGVVFPELEGEQAFDEVSATLDLIEALAPLTVVPGHGPVFVFSHAVMGRARRRLDSFALDPVRHAQHAGKVLLKFKLLEVQQQLRPDFMAWALSMPYMVKVHQRFFSLDHRRDRDGQCRGRRRRALAECRGSEGPVRLPQPRALWHFLGRYGGG
jgi:glyoxylase-like metal-dependent hydrolase (beta-lactamase superfamily II)